MPQKVCGGCILQVMAFAFVFEMPQNRTVSIFLIFLFEIWSRVFFRNAHFFMLDFFEMPQILFRMLQMIRKWGISKKSGIKKWAFRKKST